MLEVCLGLLCCIPLFAALMLAGVFLQAILDALGGKKRKKKQSNAAQTQQDVREETLLLTWRNTDG